MLKPFYHLFVWCLLSVTALIAQEAVTPAPPAAGDELTEFQKLFKVGQWAKALAAAGEDVEQKLLVSWRLGDLPAVEKLASKGDQIRIASYHKGPVEAVKIARGALGADGVDPLILVEGLAAAVLSGDAKSAEEFYKRLPKPRELTNRQLERLADVQPHAGRLLGKPELTRHAAIDLTQIGMDRFSWNPRYKVLRAMYYYRAGQRIDATDWAKELLADGSQDPYFGLLPPESKLKLADPDSVKGNIRLLIEGVNRQMAGIETFTGVKRLDQIGKFLEPLETVAPAHPVAIAAREALKFAKGAEAGFPPRLSEVTVKCGLYWHYLAQITGDAFDRGAALPWGRKAIEVEPWNVDMLVAHAINCHREGQPEEALRALDRAHAVEPRLSQVWNLRTLIRSVIKNFVHHKEEGFDIRMRRDEWVPFKDLLLPRIREESDLLAKRYGSRPDRLHFILYTDKQDFDVSVFMVPSAPAIGACMGRLVTMPSPSFLQYKTEPWAPVLRHEMAHAWHIHLSKGRVTRWFTEGLAHYEEVVRHGEWDWEEGYDQLLVDLHAGNKLAPFGRLNEGFNGENVRFYYQYCRWVMEWLDREHGWDSVVDCLKAYSRGVDDNNLFKEVIGLTNEEAEKGFRTWLKKNVLDRIPYPPRIKGPPTTVPGLAWNFQEGRFFEIMKATEGADDPQVLLWRARSLEELEGADKALALYRKIEKRLDGHFMFHYAYGRNLADSGDWKAAIPQLEKAIGIYPDRVRAHDNPWYFLYQCHKALKNEQAALDTIWKYTRIQQKDHRARFWLTRRYLEAGEWGKSRKLIRELSEIHPFNFELILWQAAQARREQSPDLEKLSYRRVFEIARLEELVDQETLLSDKERLGFMKKAIRPWLQMTTGRERQEAARLIEQFFPDNGDVQKALIEP